MRCAPAVAGASCVTRGAVSRPLRQLPLASSRAKACAQTARGAFFHKRALGQVLTTPVHSARTASYRWSAAPGAACEPGGGKGVLLPSAALQWVQVGGAGVRAVGLGQVGQCGRSGRRQARTRAHARCRRPKSQALQDHDLKRPVTLRLTGPGAGAGLPSLFPGPMWQVGPWHADLIKRGFCKPQARGITAAAAAAATVADGATRRQAPRRQLHAARQGAAPRPPTAAV